MEVFNLMYKDYNIGTIAKLLGISSETLRYYESKHGIKPKRDPETGYRYYTRGICTCFCRQSITRAMDIR